MMSQHTEPPKTFDTVEEGKQYHIDNELIGWFFVGSQTYWTYKDGDYITCEEKPENMGHLKNVTTPKEVTA